MILVNNPGNWSSVFESLTHADWNGCTLADLVFPFFIFILGAAMPFAFGRRIERGHQRRDLYLRIARRSASLIALGLILNVIAAAPAVIALRMPGVLQRIGIVYLLAAPIVINARPAWRAVTLAVLVIGHWALLLVSLGGAPAGLAQAHNLAGFIDQAAFGRHILTPTGDPEGILGTLPAIGSAVVTFRLHDARSAVNTSSGFCGSHPRPFARLLLQDGFSHPGGVMKRIIEVTLVLGFWLIVAPFVLAYSRGHIVVALNDVVLGVPLVAGSIWILAAEAGQLTVTTFGGACGAWLMCAPLVLHSRALPHVLVNDLAVGAVVLIVSLTYAGMLTRITRHAR
jgi:hypothetical protein